jgi:hypothetical protein
VWPGLGQDDARRVVDAMRPLLAASPADGAGVDALTDAIAYAIARAPVPAATDTARDVAARLAPLVIESGWVAVPAPLDDGGLDA